MSCPRIAVLGTFLALGIGALGGAFAAWPEVSAAMAPTLESGLGGTVSELSLSEAQRGQVAEILADAADRLEKLEAAMTVNGQRLRAAELERPFDALLVNRLIAQQAELMAFTRGTESRAVAEIASLLSPEQHAQFAQLRTAVEDGRHDREVPAAARGPEDARADEGRSMRPSDVPQPRGTKRRAPRPARATPWTARLASAS